MYSQLLCVSLEPCFLHDQSGTITKRVSVVWYFGSTFFESDYRLLKLQVLGPDTHEPKKKLKNIVMQATRYDLLCFIFGN